MKRKKLLICVLFLVPNLCSSQIFVSNGALIEVRNNAILHCNGGIVLTNQSIVSNDGEITTTKQSTNSNPGNFELTNQTTVSGNGVYKVEQNWINDAQFQAQNSDVILFGNTEQFVTSNTNTNTVFHRLTLQGNGTGVNRRKTLLNVDATVNQNGILQLNNRELFTNERAITVENTANNAILFDNTFENEGFIASENDGYLMRYVDNFNPYIFPLGSSVGTRRFRPISITATENNMQLYAARLNNRNATMDGYALASKQEELGDLNPLYYHSIEQLIGNDSATITFQYVSNNDGSFSNAGNWNAQITEWRNTSSNTSATAGNFDVVQRVNWSFIDKNHPYILTSQSTGLSIPNVFTPNGDGVNDVFFVNAKGLENFNMIILNRWGNVVFETNDPAAIWDGTFKGKPLSDGVYFYRLTAIENKIEIEKSGHITIQ